MQSTGRRTFLATGALAAAGLLAACTSGSGSGSGSPGSGGKGKPDPDLPLRTRAVAATDALLAQYAALPAGSAGGAPVAELQAELVKQRAALASGLPASSAPSAAAASSPATAAASTAASGSPAGGTVAALAGAERSTAQARLADLAAASPELARLLASAAAAGALHAVRLGDQTPLTVPADTPSAGAPSAGAPSADGGSPSSSPSTPNPPSAGATAALQAALAAEHAAVYAFGVVGAKVPPGPKRDEARAGYAAHQARRDAWQRILAAAGATPAAAAPGYQLPFAVPDPAAAGRLAAEVESRLTAVYADLVAAGSGGLRMTAATALRECVLQCAHWGGASTALPGLAEPAASPSAGSASASGSPR